MWKLIGSLLKLKWNRFDKFYAFGWAWQCTSKFPISKHLCHANSIKSHCQKLLKQQRNYCIQYQVIELLQCFLIGQLLVVCAVNYCKYCFRFQSEMLCLWTTPAGHRTVEGHVWVCILWPKWRLVMLYIHTSRILDWGMILSDDKYLYFFQAMCNFQL